VAYESRCKPPTAGMALRTTHLSITLERLPAWFQSNDRAQSLLRIGAWAGAYFVVHRATYALSLIAAPKSKPGGVDLDCPRPQYVGCSLRKVTAARAASFVHAVGSFAWNAKLMRRHLAVLRDVANRRPIITLLGRSLPLLAYDASNDLGGARAALCHSLGYFLQELAHVLCHEPDPVFVAHHVAYLAATLPIVVSERGWALVSLGTLLAEATNPLQLCWELARAYGCEEVYDALSPPFTFGFALCRGVLMPLAMGDMALSLFGRAGARAPPAMRFAYGVFFVGIGASGVWLAQLVRGFRRYRRKKRLVGRPARTRDRRDSNCI